jgi:hypothetical protein
MQNIKNLIVCGDSFTEGHDMGETASWAYWIADTLNLKLKNLASGGMSNEWISLQTITFLQKNPELWDSSVVIIAWTEMMRQMIHFDDMGGKIGKWIWSAQPNDFISDDCGDDTPGYWIYKHRDALYPFFSDLNWALMKTYQSMLMVKTFCDSKGIPYMFFDAVNDNKLYFENDKVYIRDYKFEKEEFNLDNSLNFVKSIVDKNMVDLLFDEKYVDVDGTPILQFIHKWGDERYCEGNSGHTNIIGAKEVSKYIIKHYERLYNKR